MSGAQRPARWRQKTAIIGGSLLLGMTYLAATPPKYRAQSVIQLRPEVTRGQAEQIAAELRAPSLVEAAGRKLGLRSTAREIEAEHLQALKIDATGQGALAMEVSASKEEWATGWAELLAAEYAHRSSKIQGAPAAQETKTPVSIEAERARLTRALDDLGRLRIQLRDQSFEVLEKLAKISAFQKVHRGADGQPIELVSEERLQHLSGHSGKSQDGAPEAETSQSSEGQPDNAEFSDLREAIAAEWAKAEQQISPLFQELLEKRTTLGGGSGLPSSDRGAGRLAIPADPARAPEPSPILQVQLISIDRPAPFRRVWILLGSLAAGGALSVLVPQTARWQRARRSAPAAFEKTTGLRHAATVPAETRLGGGPLVGAPSAPSPEFQDAFQKLASALLQGDQRVFTVSSAQAGEGKTIITGNLGVALATGGRRVLLIDACEQRRPLLQLFGFRPRKGLAELLRNEASIEEVVRPSMTAGLSLLGYGLSGTSWGGWPMLLAELRNRFDVIVLDTAPILDSAKVAPVHRTADYVLFVAAAGSASKSELREAVKLLRKSGGTLEHFVINQLRLP